MIVDTSALLAYFDADEPDHEAFSAAFAESPGPFVVSPYVVAEVDYLIATRLGVREETTALGELSNGAWDLASIDIADLAKIVSVIEQYADQEIGAADASNVVLAERYQTTEIATLDRRHFDVLRPLTGGYFDILPKP